jgi:hypothetical protein
MLLAGFQSAGLSSLRIRQEGGVVAQADGSVEDWKGDAKHCQAAERSACNKTQGEP